MKISDVSIRRLRVLEDVGVVDLAWSPGEELLIQKGGGTFIEISTDEGITGIGPEVDERHLPKLKELLIDKDPAEVEALSAMLAYYFPSGTHYQYIAGVDIALWDIVGKKKGLPLYQLWGGEKHRIVPYAAMILLSRPEERAEMALQLKEQGWQAIKLRLHHESMKDDILTVEKVRDAVGPDMHIMVDANQAQSKSDWQPGVRWDYQRAYDTALELQRLDCAWLEEPRPRYAFDELSKMTRELDIPIAGGENSRVLFDFEQMCERNAYSILQPECLVVTGITETLRIGKLAYRYGKQVIPHNGSCKLGLIAHMHMVASWPHAPFLEMIHDPPIGSYQNFFTMFADAPTVDDDGFIALPQSPGLGVTIDEGLVLPD